MNGTVIPRVERTRDANIPPPRDDAETYVESTIAPSNANYRYSDVRVHTGSAVDGTNLEVGVKIHDNLLSPAGNPPIARAYPHLMDGVAGEACAFVSKALESARRALDLFSEADLDGINTSLSVIAVTMAKAHPLTTFNESFGAVLSFIRRATLIASSADLTRPALNGLVQVFNALIENPFLDLTDAADLIGNLAELGWEGEHKAVEKLVAVLLDDGIDEEMREHQSELFQP